MTPNSNYLF